MFELAALREGARVLDVGTRTGDVALLAAARIGPTGSVVATDVSPSMIEATIAAARAAELPWVDTLADALSLGLPDASFDSATARNVLMFVDDIPRVLSGVRRVLRKGGRFAASTWAELETNPFTAIVVEVIRARTCARELARAHAGVFALRSDRPHTVVRIRRLR